MFRDVRKILPNQNGAPVRVIFPWKYGFKSAKSIVKIILSEKNQLHHGQKQHLMNMVFMLT